MSTTIQQQTEGDLINVQNILDLVNAKRKANGLEEKEIRNYFFTKNGDTYIKELLSKINRLQTPKNPSELQKTSKFKYLATPKDSPKLLDDEAFYTENNLRRYEKAIQNINGVGSLLSKERISIKDLKPLGLYKETRKTKNKEKGIWFTPLLAIDIVGWLDPEIKLHFNEIVLAELSKRRVIISDKIRELTDNMRDNWGDLDHYVYSQLNMAINFRIFGKNYIGIRDNADRNQLDNIVKLINNLNTAIDLGMITTPTKLINLIDTIKLR